MNSPVPPATESPALRLRLAPRPRGARRPLLVAGDLDRSPRAWGRISDALEADRYYLGPEIGGDFDQAIPHLLRWRYECLWLDVAGILVPPWRRLDTSQKDQISVLANHWPTAGSNDRPATFERVPNKTFVLPVFQVQGSRLAQVPHVLSGARSEASILADLAAHIPVDVALSPELENVMYGTSTNLRDFNAAKRTAGVLRARDWPGRQIGRYLATYGYTNARGVVGAWHHARLTEVMQDDRRE